MSSTDKFLVHWYTEINILNIENMMAKIKNNINKLFNNYKYSFSLQLFIYICRYFTDQNLTRVFSINLKKPLFIMIMIL